MLDKIRKESASLGSKFIFGFLALVFIFWAGGTASKSKPWAAKVNGKIIPAEQFERQARQQIEARRRRSPDGRIDEAQEQFIMRSVFDQMVEEELLVQEAQRLGFVVTDEEYRDKVLEIPGPEGKPLFQTESGDAVSDDRYREIIESFGYTPEKFEALITRDLLKQKMEQFIKDSVKVTDGELWEEYQIRQDKVNLSFVRITPVALASTVKVTDEEVQAWADENESKIKSYYDSVLSTRYLQPKTATIHRITVLKPVPEPDQEEPSPAAVKEARERADKALEAAKTDVVAAGRQFAEGPEWEKKGETRTFQERQLEGPVATQVFSMTPDAPPAMVETSRGWVIVKVTGMTEESQTPLEDVRLNLARELLEEEKADSRLDEFVDQAIAALQSGKSLEEAVAGTPLEVRETGKFTRQQPPTALGGTAEGLMEAAFSLENPGDVLLVDGSAPKIRNATILAVLKSREKPDETDFENAKKSLRFSVRLRKEGAAYRAWREKAQEAARIKANADLGLTT